MPSLALLALRLVFGLGIALHGYQTLFVDGIGPLRGMIEAQGWPLPAAWAYAAKITEFGGGILLLLGLFTRWAALATTATMGVAIWMTGVHLGEALIPEWELAALYAAAFLALLLSGAGKISADGWRRRRARHSPRPVSEEPPRPAPASSEAWDGREDAIA